MSSGRKRASSTEGPAENGEVSTTGRSGERERPVRKRRVTVTAATPEVPETEKHGTQFNVGVVYLLECIMCVYSVS